MPFHSKSCDIVVPCYNEEARLDGGAFLKFAKENSDISFTFVDDGSRDGTAALLDQLRRRNVAQFHVVQLKKNGGKAAAVREGVRHVQSRGAARFFGYFDADGAIPLPMIHRLREALDSQPNLLAAFASRTISGDSDVRRSRTRWLCSRACSLLIRSLLRIPMRDTQCGAKLFRASSSTYGWFADPFQTRWLFDVEVIARAMLANGLSRQSLRQQFHEVAVTSWYDVAGSKVKFRDVSNVVGDLWRIWRMLHSDKPLTVATQPLARRAA